MTPRLWLALLRATPRYWLAVFPRATWELRGWRLRARTIPDAVLREQALAKLDGERLAAEGAAAFAILADRRHRARAVRASIAFELLYDYVDALSEVRPTAEDNLRLHRALHDAFAPAPIAADYYEHHPRDADGGYLVSLVEACRAAFAALPASATVRAALLRAALRAGEAQSLNHTGAAFGPAPPDHGWARDAAAAGLLRWELIAAASSPLGIHALVAAACDPRTSRLDADAIDDAYLLGVGALAWLLESLVDRLADARDGSPGHISRYDSERQATERLAWLARRAAEDLSRLPRHEDHLVLLAGMVALQLSHAGARDASAERVASAVQAAVGPLVTPLLLMLSLRRLTDRRGRRAAAPAAPPAHAPRRRRRAAARR